MKEIWLIILDTKNENPKFDLIKNSIPSDLSNTLLLSEEINKIKNQNVPSASKEELIDFSIRSGAPAEVVENLQELEDDGQPYESIEEIWPDYPTEDDFLFNKDEY